MLAHSCVEAAVAKRDDFGRRLLECPLDRLRDLLAQKVTRIDL